MGWRASLRDASFGAIPDLVAVETRVLTSRKDRRRFAEFAESVYRHYPLWVPPLRMEIRTKLIRCTHPFYEYGTVDLIGAFGADGTMLGRVAVIRNPRHNERFNDRTGFFGFFECENSLEVCSSLFLRAREHLQASGVDRLVGPVNFTTNDESGVLVEGYDLPPQMMCDYSPPYYDELLAACGFSKAMDLYSYRCDVYHPFPEKFMEVGRRAAEAGKLTVRRINMRDLSREIEFIARIYNQSFADLWGFVPLTENEAREMAAGFKLIADPDLILIALRENNPVGCLIALPDINVILARIRGHLGPVALLRLASMRRRLQTARLIVLGVLPDSRSLGTAALMLNQLVNAGREKGYSGGEISVVVENNVRMRLLLKNLGFQTIKRYRIYETDLH